MIALLITFQAFCAAVAGAQYFGLLPAILDEWARQRRFRAVYRTANPYR